VIKKNLKIFMVILILGIGLSITIFLPTLEGGYIFGTRTTIDNPDSLWHYYGMYGIDGLADRHIMGDDYCVDAACDCVNLKV